MLVNKNILGKKQYVLPHASQYRSKLDIIENQYALCPEVLLAVSDACNAFHLYPSRTRTYHELIRRISGYTGCVDGNIILTNGSDNALKLLCEAYITPESRVLVPIPTYPHFQAFSSSMYSAGITDLQINIGDDVAGKVRDALSAQHHNLVYLCSPNLPLGYTLTNAEIDSLLVMYPDTMFIVDEAYYEYRAPDDKLAESAVSLLHRGNIVVTRTFSKAFGLAALRIGYLMSRVDNIEQLRVLVNEKNVTMTAIAAAEACLANLEYYSEQIRDAARVKQHVRDELMGLISPDSPIYACLVEAGNAFLIFARNAENVVATFARHGILIRNKHSDVPYAVRIAFGTGPQMEDVLDVIRLINMKWVLSRGVVFDLDNTLRPGSKHSSAPYDDTARVLGRYPYTICSNNSTYTPAAISDYFHDHGVCVPESVIETPLTAARREFSRCGYTRVLVIGNDSVKRYFGDVAVTLAPYDACLVACDYFVDADTAVAICTVGMEGKTIYYPDDCDVTTLNDCADLTQNGDTRVPDVGMLVGALHKMGYNVRLVGKPNPDIIGGRRSTVIGDSVRSDGGLAAATGSLFVHVDAKVSEPTCLFGGRFAIPSISWL